VTEGGALGEAIMSGVRTKGFDFIIQKFLIYRMSYFTAQMESVKKSINFV